MKRTLTLCALCSLLACRDAPDMKHDLFNRGGALYVQSESDAAALDKRVVAAVDKAEIRVLASFESLTSEPIANALVRAHSRGVDVRVVADVDHKQEAGLALLLKKLGRLDEKTARVQLMGGALS